MAGGLFDAVTACERCGSLPCVCEPDSLIQRLHDWLFKWVPRVQHEAARKELDAILREAQP